MKLNTQIQNRSLLCVKGNLVENRERGFTLIELMIVVAIIGLLAGLAVVTFGRTQKKASAKAEVTPMFAEMHTKQAQYRLENSSFLSTSDANDEADMWPAAPSSDGGKQALLPYPTPSNWNALRITPEQTAVRCAYVMVVGDGGDNSNVGAIADANFGFVAPADDWYYLLAQCDMDQNSTTDSYYFQQMGDSEMYFVNEGK